MDRFQLSTFPVRDKTVLLRVDFNVPLHNGKVADDTKIRASVPTIRFLLEQNCKIILATHLGKPAGKHVEELTTDVLGQTLQKILKTKKITKFNACFGKEIKQVVAAARTRQLFLLENLRFYREEAENALGLAHALADLADVYVNDAFAVCHRKHASVEAITHFLPSIPGLLVEKEIRNLNEAVNPLKPAIWIMGGAKLNKVELMSRALKKADVILVGGALAFSFLRAQNIPTGMSKVDRHSIQAAKKLMRWGRKKKIMLPLDFAVADSLSYKSQVEIVPFNGIPDDKIGLDIGPKTLGLFKQHLRKARTVVWNGPLGYVESAKFAWSTKEIGRFLGGLTATRIAGGGETAEAIHKFHLTHNFTHVSTGGGATLAFLAGKTLPGLDALFRNYKKFHKKIHISK